MNEIILTITIILTIALIVMSRSVLAPISIFSVLASGNAIVFYIVSFLEFYPDRVTNWWQVKNNYQEVGQFVFLFYLILVLIAAIANALHNYSLISDKKKISKYVKQNQGINSKKTSDILLSRYLISLPMLSLLLFVVLLIWMHCLQVDFSKVVYYNEYLSIRNNPEMVGIKEEIFKIIHTNLPIIGCLMSAVAILYFRLHKPVFFY